MSTYDPLSRTLMDGRLILDVLKSGSRYWGTPHVSRKQKAYFISLVESYGGGLDLIDMAIDVGFFDIPSMSEPAPVDNPNRHPVANATWVQFCQYINLTEEGHEQIADGLIAYSRLRKTAYSQKTINVVSLLFDAVDSNNTLIIPNVMHTNLHYIGYTTGNKVKRKTEALEDSHLILPTASLPVRNAFVNASPKDRIAVASESIRANDAELRYKERSERVDHLETRLSIDDRIALGFEKLKPRS